MPNNYNPPAHHLRLRHSFPHFGTAASTFFTSVSRVYQFNQFFSVIIAPFFLDSIYYNSSRSSFTPPSVLSTFWHCFNVLYFCIKGISAQSVLLCLHFNFFFLDTYKLQPSLSSFTPPSVLSAFWHRFNTLHLCITASFSHALISQ